MRIGPWRACLLLFILGGSACSGSVSCSSCGGCAGPLAAIPGGFDPSAEIDRAGQMRLTRRGLDFLEAEFPGLMAAYVRMRCGRPEDVPCPTGFLSLPGGASNPSTCDPTAMACVERSGASGPLVGFEIENTTSSGATICRDDPSDPNRRRCYAWLRFEDLGLATRAPDQIDATITAQIYTTDIPLQYNLLDCIVSLDSGASGSPLQGITVTARVTEWVPPSGRGGRQLKLAVDSVDAMIPDMDVRIARDPVHGDLVDVGLCGLANLGVVKNALIPRLTSSLRDVVEQELDKALGWKCVGQGALPCPAQTVCNMDGFCEDPDGDVVPAKLGAEGRMDFSSLLGGLTAGRPGQGDLSLFVGGASAADPSGLNVGVLGGAEVVTPDLLCSRPLPSPRLRAGWSPPPPLPAEEFVDLDYDGVPETPYMVAAGLSDAFLDQVIWSIYSTGLFCQRVSAYDAEVLNTGSLSLLMPSLAQLTHGDRYRDAIFPARLSLYPRGEPTITLGSGKVDRSRTMPILEDPLIDLFMDDLELNFYAVIEERWVRLMTVTMDMHFGFGAIVTPANEVQLVLSDLAGALSDVRVTNSEILAEDPADLADALPSLFQIALPQFSGAFPPFPLPSGEDLAGFELTVLGIRGVESTPGMFPNLAVYADLGFDPSLVPALSVAAETFARIVDLRTPDAALFDVGSEGGPEPPEVEIALDGHAPHGRELEYQLRVDRGFWTPFFRAEGASLTLRRSEFLVQGHHMLEVRARVVGDYRSLDPTPVVLDALIDAEPPRLAAYLSEFEGGAFVDAYDTVSGDRVQIDVGIGGDWQPVTLSPDGFVAISGLEGGAERIAVRATDEAGLRSEVTLRTARGALMHPGEGTRSYRADGCRCAHSFAHTSAWGAAAFWLLLAMAGPAGTRRRRAERNADQWAAHARAERRPRSQNGPRSGPQASVAVSRRA